MSKHLLRTFLLLVASALWATDAHAEFKNFAANISTGEGTLLTADELANKKSDGALEFYIGVNAQGKTVRVENGDATQVATIKGGVAGNGVGWSHVYIPVEKGKYKITIGLYTNWEHEYILKNAEGEVVAQETLTSAGDWTKDKSQVIELIYNGPATTLHLDGKGHIGALPYIAAERVVSTVTKEKAIYTTDFTDWESVKAGAEAQTVSKTTKDGTPLTFTLYQAQVNPTGENTAKFTNADVVSKGWMMTEKQSGPYMTISTFPSITKVSFVQAATGGKRGLTLYVKGDGDADWVALHNQAIGKAQGEKLEYAVNRTNCQLKFGSFAESQNGYLLSLEVYANVTVEGAEYALTTVATEGGKAEKYPNAATYTEGDEVRLTATPAFGYHFTSWTDKDGNVVSQEPEFKYTVTAENTLTANFQAVQTYSLTTAVDGGANDYMVTLSPAPTMVDGKQMYEAGTQVTATAASNPVVAFTNWSDGQTSASIDITMDGDKTLTAHYAVVKDCIVAWDFEQSGGSGRQADFYAADNDAVQLVMRNEAGQQQGWLDKSMQAAGGYEGRAAAVNWRTDTLGTWYWQTQFNASAFTDIEVQTAMTYNYNAYQKQDIQYSLDGET